MATVSLIKEVAYDFSEYVGSIDISAADDVIEMEFNSPVIIDQIAFNSNTSNVYEVELIYPSSESSAVLKSSGTGDWALNDSNSSGQMWYRLPARGKVRVTTSTYSSAEALTLAVLGRNG
jgi:hypothetical protein